MIKQTIPGVSDTHGATEESYVSWLLGLQHPHVNTTLPGAQFYNSIHYNVLWGHAVAQLVVALRYKSEGRGFNSRWRHWNFPFMSSFRPDYGPGVDSASNRNEYQEYFLGGKGGRCVGLTTLTPSCAKCLEIWEPQPPGSLRACPGL